MGVLVSAAGVALSFQLDLPTGAAIVATFGAALLLVAVYRKAFHRPAIEASPRLEEPDRQAVRSGK
jgi:hypothetical protein